MDKLSQTDECITIGKCNISRLLFADDLVLLAFSESGLQHIFNGFAAACDIAGMKISTSKTEKLHHLRSPVQCSLQFGGVSLKQMEKLKYLEVIYVSDNRQDEELDIQSSKANPVMRALRHSVALNGSYRERQNSQCWSWYLNSSLPMVMNLGLWLKKCDYKCKRPKWNFS